METSFKNIVYFALIIIIAFMSINFFSANGYKKKLDKMENNLNSALHELNYSKLKIDSIRNDLLQFRYYVNDVRTRVEILDLEKRMNQREFISKRDSIKKRLETLYLEAESTGALIDSVIDLHQIP